MILRATGPIHGGSSVESGLEPETLRPQNRDRTTRPPRPQGWNREDLMFVTGHGPFILSTFEQMTTARAEKKEIQWPMPQNVGLPSPTISKLLQCNINYRG
ncbi:hypothetical protein AVEN_245734-1 [Araneus ventricosus]|uniref:Uncharacterized protein n=1 Tax=Araneus ventricosus TaxID=182803 RepID=A0A4Y2LFZ1_ARAVE|nr:hypothetical protein AVEN_245734-1 [Araneus ventricosus]